MRRQSIAAFGILVILAGCGSVRDSRINPFNWFGPDRGETLTPKEIADKQDARPRVDQVVSLRAEQVTGGAIVNAVGLPLTQGFYSAELVQIPSDQRGVLDLEFRIVPPQRAIRQGTQASREVTVAKLLTSQDLAGVTTIRVLGARNVRSVRR